MERAILFFINGFFCILVGYFIGKKRHIGFLWSTFLCLGMSIFIGIIITFISPKLDSPPHKPTKSKLIFAIISIAIGALPVFLHIDKFVQGAFMTKQEISSFSGGSLLFTLGLYLYHLSKSNSNTSNILR